MKELSIKEKAQRYDKALERAMNVSNSEWSSPQALSEYIFPELAESEDEKIRKYLIDVVNDYCKGSEYDGCIAWLEKQGEKFQYWKPSEEQLEALDYAYNSCPDTERGNYYEGVLETLIDDLHKLSEKQGEQKPTEDINGEDYGIDGLYAAMDILNKTLGQVEGYQSDDGILEHKAAMTAIKKLYKQRSAEWSVEDKKMYNAILRDVRNGEPLDKLQYDWLKSLKDRVQPQNTWKPSDEQMKALEFYIYNDTIDKDGVYGSVIVKLYEQLKTLL